MQRRSRPAPRLGRVLIGTITLATLVAAAAAASIAGPAAAQEGDGGRVDVVQVDGLLDPILASHVERSISDAESAGSVGIVLQVDSGGTVVDDDRVEELAERIAEARIPVWMWIGPSGADATEGMAELAGVVERLGVAPGSRVGDLGTPALPDDAYRPEFARLLDRLTNGTLDDVDALELGVAARPAPVIGDFIVDLPGVETRVVGEGEQRRRETVTVPRFSRLPLIDQLMHTVASPPVAYLLLVAGLALIVFELYTAGVGVAGLTGAGAFVLGSFGLAALPARWWAVGLLVTSMIAFAVDVQSGVPRVWTSVGTAAFIVGSLLLYDGVNLSWIPLVVGIVGIVLFMVAGMPAMVRSRFSTPTIGRGWMIGEQGDAVVAVDPEGVVRIRGALWRARTNRATPIDAGATVRVIEVDGLLLEVEPEEGGARDYRERARPDASDSSA